MDYTKVPTDNLYKFMSIAGMVIVILSVAFPVRYWYDLNMQQVEMAAAMTMWELKAEHHQNTKENRLDYLMQFVEDSEHLSTKRARIGALAGWWWSLLWCALTSLFLGLALTVCGFRMWYARLQVHQDRLLKAQADGVQPSAPSSNRPATQPFRSRSTRTRARVRRLPRRARGATSG